MLCGLAVLLPPLADAQNVSAISATNVGPATVTTAPATAAMGDRLKAIFAATDWKQDPNKSERRAAYYQQMVEHQQLSAADRLQVLLQMAIELLQAGQPEMAIAAIDQMRTIFTVARITLPAEFEQRFHKTAAIAYLRLGEKQNCTAHHGRLACIFPVHGSGVHTRTEGAQGAVKELTVLLENNPQDWQSEWLLNVAYMQWGRYPAGVPAKWLVPAGLFKSEANVGNFPDVAMEAGLSTMAHSGGVVMEDLSGDGLLDIVVTSSGPLDQMRLFHNNGDGTFTDLTKEAGLLGEVGGLNIISTDYDNDGHIDLLVLRGAWWGKYGEYPISLLHNRGDGTFEDVTVKSGLLSAMPTQTAAWADYDGDGWVDLFVGHETEVTPDGKVHYPSQLFHNNHDGTFTEVGASMGLANLGFVKGVAWGDFNNDSRPDLYVSVKGGANHLLRNDGPGRGGAPWRFTDVTRQAGVVGPFNSFATWFFDYDNDGWPDLFVAGYSTESMNDVGAFELGKPSHAQKPRLYRNNHDGTFTDVSAQTHLDRAILTMGAGFGDLDNDGWLDVYLGTGEPSYEALLPNHMFRNDRGRRFEDVTTSGGFGNLQKSHGVAFGDLCNTGHEDVFEEMGGAFPGDTSSNVVYRNPGNSNHWVTLKLEGVRANRAAIGARLDVTIVEGGAVRHIFRTVGFGSSFGASTLRQHIGIGQSAEVKSVEVRWPGSGTVQHFANLAADRSYRLRQGDPQARATRTKPCTLGGVRNLVERSSAAN